MSKSLLLNPTAVEAGLHAALAARDGLDDIRRTASEAFVRSGLPHRRMEGWRWSDFRAAARDVDAASDAASRAPADQAAFAPLDAVEIPLTDDGPVLPEGVGVAGLSLSLEASTAPASSIENPFAALNVAYAEEILSIGVAPGAKLERPVLIRDLRGAGAPFIRIRFDLGAQASAGFGFSLERGSRLSASLVEIAIDEGARLDYFVLADGLDDGVAHMLSQVSLGSGADFRSMALSTGGELTRIETDLTFHGAGARARIDTAALVGDGKHADFTTHVRFRAPDCETRQRHKGVARGRGQAVFQGKFLVDRPAQKTDAKMAANALLLSEAAEANHKPELEIYADDVECAHGSTVGSLDADALFYLRQRGLDDAAARSLLIEAFVGEVIEGHAEEAIRDIFRARLTAWLAAGE